MAKKSAYNQGSEQETSKRARPTKRPTVKLAGHAISKVAIEVRITDPSYEVRLLADDFKHQRVWFEGPPDKNGWMALSYSADGHQGDPFPIGRIHVQLPSDVEFGELKAVHVKPIGD